MAGAAGLEPVTSAVTGQRSNQLSYAPAQWEAKLEEAPPLVNGEFSTFPVLPSDWQIALRIIGRVKPFVRVWNWPVAGGIDRVSPCW